MKNSITGTILGYIVILILISGMICLFFLIRKILFLNHWNSKLRR